VGTAMSDHRSRRVRTGSQRHSQRGLRDPQRIAFVPEPANAHPTNGPRCWRQRSTVRSAESARKFVPIMSAECPVGSAGPYAVDAPKARSATRPISASCNRKLRCPLSPARWRHKCLGLSVAARSGEPGRARADEERPTSATSMSAESVASERCGRSVSRGPAARSGSSAVRSWLCDCAESESACLRR
jgi:hypothetical protein